MRKIVIIIFCFFSLQFFAQEQQLAYQYFRNGEYKKAASLYKNLHKQHPYNSNYTKYLIDCYQQLEEFELSDSFIQEQLKNYPSQTHLYVDLGYNLQLQHLNEEALPFYNKALSSIEESPNIGYQVGRTFEENHLLDFALQAYKKTMTINPKSNYNFQIAKIYGEQGEIGKMFNTYLDMVSIDEKYMLSIKSYIGTYITDDAENEHNISLKKALLKRSQNNPRNSWNLLLSWLYIQQKDYFKALIQEKALYKRNPEDLKEIINLGAIAFDNNDFSTSVSCFDFVIEHTSTLENQLIAKLYLLQISIESNAENEAIEKKFQQLFSEYGKSVATLNIQLSYADFTAFKKNDAKKAIAELKQTLKLPLNQFQNGLVKTKLADVFVLNNQFSTALIYYTQVQNKLKNHEIGQAARFKIAQTSYFKGDFEWAQTQLKVLKNSTSQLIANDALDLNLLITDNGSNDSLKVALKKYATSDLLSFQNKNKQAIDTLQDIITNFKEHPIEDESLFKQAKLYEDINEFELAEQNYLQIIKKQNNDILIDDAHYYLAELYLNKLNNIEKSKEHFQIIIFEFPSSIYLVDARKKFRKLRGDAIN